MINANWARWIFASATYQFVQSGYFIEWHEYLKDIETYNSNDIIPVYITGQEFAPKDVQHYVELRIDGPDFTEVSKGDYRAKIEVNVLVTTTKSDSDFHAIHRYTGRVQSVLAEGFTIYRFGDGAEDDNSPLACMDTIMWASGEGGNRVETKHFGQIYPDIPLIQASVNVRYKTELDG